MNTVEWKVKLKSSPDKIYGFLSTDHGRSQFWAEKALEEKGIIHFTFPNGVHYQGEILHAEQNKAFHIDYFNSLLKFTLMPSEDGGTELHLINEGISDDEYLEVHAGWVSVLLNLKAVADHGCDLRNHDRTRTWDQKFVDN